MSLVEEMKFLLSVYLNSRLKVDFHLDVAGHLDITLEFFLNKGYMYKGYILGYLLIIENVKVTEKLNERRGKGEEPVEATIVIMITVCRVECCQHFGVLLWRFHLYIIFI